MTWFAGRDALKRSWHLASRNSGNCCANQQGRPALAQPSGEYGPALSVADGVINEIQRLKAQGYNNSDIGRKLDIDRPTIIGLIALKKAARNDCWTRRCTGRFLWRGDGHAKTDGAETQRALLKAYEKKQLNQASIRDIKKLMEQRRFLGKQRGSGGRGSRKNRPSAENLVSVYRRESENEIAGSQGAHLRRKAVFCGDGIQQAHGE